MALLCILTSSGGILALCVHDSGLVHTMQTTELAAMDACCEGGQATARISNILHVTHQHDACIDIYVEGADQSLYKARNGELKVPLLAVVSSTPPGHYECPVQLVPFTPVQPQAPPKLKNVHHSVPKTVFLI